MYGITETFVWIQSNAEKQSVECNLIILCIWTLQFLAMMVSEAEQVLNDVLKSTSELKELLAFSTKLQNSVCLLDFVSSCACMEHI